MNRRIAALALLAVAMTGCNATSLWTMNETTGTVMNDVSGSNNGTTTNVGRGTPSYNGSGYYSFNGTSSIARVPHSASLNPGTARFTFGAYVKFSAVPPPTTFDVIRKGVSPSQYYKIELFDSGTSKGVRAKCYVKGSTGTNTVVLGQNLNGNVWHKMSCSRDGDTLTFEIKTGTTTRSAFRTQPTGSVANTSDLTIGAKPTPGDFYNGLIDDATVSVG